jgi:hypothetical protein
MNNALNIIADDYDFFNTWLLVGCFLGMVFIFALFIKYRSSHIVSFTTNEGWSFMITDYSVRLTGAELLDYDFITGIVKVKLLTGEEKVYNILNTISIVGVADKYGVISGLDNDVTQMFIKYALTNRLYDRSLDIIDYNHDTKELIYIDSRSGKHSLKLGVKGFYNVDYAKIDAQTSSGGSFLTGFFVGRYLK